MHLYKLRLHHLGSACTGALLLACAAPGHAPDSAALITASVTARDPAGDAVSAPPTPSDADAWYALGRQQHAAQQPAQALAAYRIALQHDASHRNARNGLAVLAAERGDYAAAILLWRALTEQSGKPAADDAFLFGNLGYAYLLHGELAPAISALQQACLLEPLRADSWEHLGLALQREGQGGQAARMRQQAQALRSHDVRADYALLGQAPASENDMPGNVRAEVDAWPATSTRSEIRQAANGVFELLRITPERARVLAPVQLPQPQPQPQPPDSGTRTALRLEIRNGNGVRGMAAALGRLVGGASLQVVRLGNEPGFRLARTRIDYRPDAAAAAATLAGQLGAYAAGGATTLQRADIRIVLGHDLRDPQLLRRRYLQQVAAVPATPSR